MEYKFVLKVQIRTRRQNIQTTWLLLMDEDDEDIDNGKNDHLLDF